MELKLDDLKNDIVNNKIAIVENKSQLNDINSSVMRTMGQLNTQSVSIEKNHKDLDSNATSIEVLEKKVANLERRVTQSTILSTIVIALIVGLVGLSYINGMNVHYQTGLDEVDNQVFVDQ